MIHIPKFCDALGFQVHFQPRLSFLHQNLASGRIQRWSTAEPKKKLLGNNVYQRPSDLRLGLLVGGSVVSIHLNHMLVKIG